MTLPPLLNLPTIEDYRHHYEEVYCRSGIMTFDGIKVRFFPESFTHAFFRDSSRRAKDKAVFDRRRAERMDWIRAILLDPHAELYKRVMPDGKIRRIALAPAVHYAVIIQMNPNRPDEARFITAYVVDSGSALQNMRANPRWT